MVAFSGGVDSSFVAALAARALGRRALAVTAVSPALAEGELDGARQVARAVGIAHETITTDELQREGYRRNDRDRCYHCKSELYEALASLARERGYAALLSGANADDLGDWRPGLRAAAEHGVVHPLLGGGRDETTQVRSLARTLAVPSAEKAATPCLASRVPYGTPVDPATLAQIDRAERAVQRSATASYACATTARSGECSSAPRSCPEPSWATPVPPSSRPCRPPATPRSRSIASRSARAR